MKLKFEKLCHGERSFIVVSDSLSEFVFYPVCTLYAEGWR
jgi:hypothetical protein